MGCYRPILLNFVDFRPIDRGYEVTPSFVCYDAKMQISDLILMGKTTPTTASSIHSWLTNDDNTGSDDEGTD